MFGPRTIRGGLNEYLAIAYIFLRHFKDHTPNRLILLITSPIFIQISFGKTPVFLQGFPHRFLAAE
jgi:hypothetical protein